MRRQSSGVVALLLVLAGCTSPAVSREPSDPVSTPTDSAPTASASPDVSDTPTDGPPEAVLAAEGGDPVTAQLGTYTWGDAGSDSAWLSGAPIAVGAGEPLSVAVEPAVAIESWRARSVPSTADGPDGASLVGEGDGNPAFAAPGAGSWTVEVRVVFADGAGDASYFWRLDVS
jgi:hypothetical protein